jgi:hypothetical protein
LVSRISDWNSPVGPVIGSPEVVIWEKLSSFTPSSFIVIQIFVELTVGVGVE